MVVNEKGDAPTNEKPNRHILGIKDNENVGYICNEIFPQVIMSTMVNLDVSMILIYVLSSCDSCMSIFLKR